MRTSAHRNLIGDFIDSIQGITCFEDLNNIFDLVMQKFHFNRYAYQLVRNEVYKSDKPLIVATYPSEWVKYYMQQSYQKIDPLVLYGSNEKLPFTWDTLWQEREITKQQSNFLHEAAEYSLAAGLSFPIRGINNSYAMITMAAANDQASGVQKLFKECEDTLHLLSLYYHNAACDLLAKSHLSEDRKPYIPLTAREKEILQWAYHHKSFGDIADILKISEHSVDSHFRNIRAKLKVHCKQEAVMRGLRLRLIIPD